MTSSGVFPNTLAAPAMAPKSPVNNGLIVLLGLSPGEKDDMQVRDSETLSSAQTQMYSLTKVKDGLLMKSCRQFAKALIVRQ